MNQSDARLEDRQAPRSVAVLLGVSVCATLWSLFCAALDRPDGMWAGVAVLAVGVAAAVGVAVTDSRRSSRSAPQSLWFGLLAALRTIRNGF